MLLTFSHFETFVLFRNKNPKIKRQAVCATLLIRLCFEIRLLGSKFWFNYNRLFWSVKRIYTIILKNTKNYCKFVIIANYHLSLLWIMATFPVKRCYNLYNTFHHKRNRNRIRYKTQCITPCRYAIYPSHIQL